MKHLKNQIALLILAIIAATSFLKADTVEQWVFIENHFVAQPEREMKSMGKQSVKIATAIMKYGGALTCATLASTIVGHCLQPNPDINIMQNAMEQLPGPIQSAGKKIYSLKDLGPVKKITPKIEAAATSVNETLKNKFPSIHTKVSDPNHLIMSLAVLGSGLLGWKLGSTVFGSPHWLVTKILNRTKQKKDEVAVLSFIENWKAGQHFEVYSPSDLEEYFDTVKAQYLSVAASNKSSYLTQLTPQVMNMVKAHIATQYE